MWWVSGVSLLVSTTKPALDLVSKTATINQNPNILTLSGPIDARKEWIIKQSAYNHP